MDIMNIIIPAAAVAFFLLCFILVIGKKIKHGERIDRSRHCTVIDLKGLFSKKYCPKCGAPMTKKFITRQGTYKDNIPGYTFTTIKEFQFTCSRCDNSKN